MCVHIVTFFHDVFRSYVFNFFIECDILSYWDSHNSWARSARVIYGSTRVNNCGNLSRCVLIMSYLCSMLHFFMTSLLYRFLMFACVCTDVPSCRNICANAMHTCMHENPHAKACTQIFTHTHRHVTQKPTSAPCDWKHHWKIQKCSIHTAHHTHACIIIIRSCPHSRNTAQAKQHFHTYSRGTWWSWHVSPQLFGAKYTVRSSRQLCSATIPPKLWPDKEVLGQSLYTSLVWPWPWPWPWPCTQPYRYSVNLTDFR
jgi:hypothetical protein